MGFILRKLAKEGIRQGEKINKIDPGNPITQDTTNWLIDIGKHIIVIGKELL